MPSALWCSGLRQTTILPFVVGLVIIESLFLICNLKPYNRINVTAKTISHWENGYTLPDISLLIPLSNILGVTVYELLSGELERKDTMNDTINQEQIPLQESEKHEKELEMTVQYAENNIKGLKHRIFNISCYVVTIMLVLLFLEVLREKHTLPDTGWLAIGAFLISMLFIPVIIVQTVVLLIQRNSKSAILLIMEFAVWVLTSYFYFFVLG